MPTNERLDLNVILLGDAIAQINPETISTSADIIQTWIDEAWAQYEITRDNFDTVWCVPIAEKPIKVVFEEKSKKIVEEKPILQENFIWVID